MPDCPRVFGKRCCKDLIKHTVVTNTTHDYDSQMDEQVGVAVELVAL